MKLIIDAGSTKTTWCVIDNNHMPLQTVRSTGINAATMSAELIGYTVDEVARQLRDTDYDSITYYGAGIVNDTAAQRVTDILSSVFTTSHIEVYSDMVGAARALLGHDEGIACILGTGSNSCLYDGEKVTANVPPLGFILGDEGSGGSLGKRFVGDLFKGLLPESVITAWNAEVGLSIPEVIERVYRRPAPSAFLASLSPFIESQLHVAEVRDLVMNEFGRFFDRNVARYETDTRLVGFVGGIATAFSAELTAVARQRGYTIASIIADPLPGLLKY